MKRSALLGMLSILFTLPAHGEILKVPRHFPTIQAGIDAATDGDVVVIADGQYTGDGNRDINFRGKAITVRSKNGPEGCIIDCERLGRGFLFDQHGTDDAVLAGVTIIRGFAPDKDPVGGGIAVRRGSPLIRDCIIRDCDAGIAGGGVMVSSGAMLRNCGIFDNRAESAGGVLASGAQLINCVISGNVTNDLGGGIAASFGVIRGCTITNNQSTENLDGGGGIYASYDLLVKDCVIEGNSAKNGGGISVYSNCVIRDCRIADNRAENTGGGIVVSSYPGVTAVENCNITGNTARSGAGVTVWSVATLTNCQMTNNTATESGGAVAIFRGYYGGEPTPIANCTFTNNAAPVGGAVFVGVDRPASIVNSILWNNTPDEVGFVNLAPDVRFCDVKGGFEGEGNIDADPLFVDGPRGGFYLSQIRAGQEVDSPCVDAGTGEAKGGVLAQTTTRTDERKDRREVDMGYHHPRRSR